MKQLIHILKKDIRYVWTELLFFYVSLGLYMWTEMHTQIDLLTLPIVAKFLVPAAAVYLIVRVVHAEALPGDNHFWLARPYRWASLLGAKLVFIAACIHLPMFLGRAAIIALQGFPFQTAFPRLVWSQLLMLLVVSLPVVLIAALTSRLVQFVCSALIGIPLIVMIDSDFSWNRIWSNDIVWFHNALLGAALALAALGCLGICYRSRRATFMRLAALVAFVSIVMIYIFVPPSLGWAANARLAETLTDTSAIQVHLSPQLELGFAGGGGRFSNLTSYNWYYARIPMQVSGVPEGVAAKTRILAVTIESPDGRVAEAAMFGDAWPGGKEIGLPQRPFGSIDPHFVNAEYDRMVTVRVSVDLLLYAKPETRSILLSDKPVRLVDGIQCSLQECRSALGWPEGLMESQDVSTEGWKWNWQFYSPFPSGGLSMDSVAERAFNSSPKKPTQSRFRTEGPYRRYHQDIELRNVRMPRPVARKYVPTPRGYDWVE